MCFWHSLQESHQMLINWGTKATEKESTMTIIQINHFFAMCFIIKTKPRREARTVILITYFHVFHSENDCLYLSHTIILGVLST